MFLTVEQIGQKEGLSGIAVLVIQISGFVQLHSLMQVCSLACVWEQQNVGLYTGYFLHTCIRICFAPFVLGHLEQNCKIFLKCDSKNTISALYLRH